MPTARVVAERYSLIRPIGRGSVAVVYVAKDKRDGSSVAVKLIPARTGLRPDEASRFGTEAARTLEHPGVASFTDAGLDTDGRTLFLVTELLHGVTLRDLIDDRSSLDTERRLNLLEGILDPLSQAHARGVVHGDLTPTNVFEVRTRTGPPVPKLLDLGLADLLATGNFAASEIRQGAVRYMAPERLTGGRAGFSSDVWSFGVMLFEALSGKKPFEGLSDDSLVRAICEAPHRPLDLVEPNVEPQMARLVDLCLDKHPGQRPHDGRALLRLIKTLRSGIAQGSDGIMSLNTVLDRTGAAPPPPPDDLGAALRRAPRDPQTHRALLAYYEGENIPDGAWLAATALDFLGAASREEIRLSHQGQRPMEVPIDRGLDANAWAALLHPDQDPRVDAVWREIVPAIAALHRREDSEVGLDKARKVDVARGDDELARAFRRSVGALRPGVIPRLYRGKAGRPPKFLPAGPAASIFGRGFEEPLPAGALSFAVGRHVAHYRNAHRVCTFLSEPDALESVFECGVTLGLERAPRSHDEQRMVELLRQHLKPRRILMLRTACQRLGTSISRVDLGTWRRAVELSCCRAGLALGGNLEGASWMLRWTREQRRLPAEDSVDDLLRFWSSGNHVRVRHVLGISEE